MASESVRQPIARLSTRTVSLLLIFVIALTYVGVLSFRRSMDFPVYYDAAIRAAQHDLNLYQLQELDSGLHYRYAPVLALLLTPLTVLPLGLAVTVWYMLKMAALLGTIWVGIRLTRFSERSAADVFVLAFPLAAGYLAEEFLTGNMHFLAFSSLVLGLYLVERGRTVLPSVLVALAILAKVIPALALPYFAVKRQWRALAGTSIALVVLCLAPSLIVGHQTNMVWLRDWTRTVIDRVEPRPSEQDDSLRGALVRFFPPPESPPARTAPIISSVPSWLVRGVWLSACAVILGLLFRTAWDSAKPSAQRIVEYPLLVVAMLLVSPHNTRIYYSGLFFPYTILTIEALQLPAGRLRGWLRVGLWLSFTANTLIPAVVPGRSASIAYESVSPFVFASALAFGLLYVLSRSLERLAPRHEAQSSQGQPTD